MAKKSSRISTIVRNALPLMLLRLKDDKQPTLVPYQNGVSLLWPTG